MQTLSHRLARDFLSFGIIRALLRGLPRVDS
jgi:hypothetical protein